MSKIAAIASRQRDCRRRAKSEIAIGSRSPTPAIRRSWVRPVPFQCDPSTTRRSAISSRSFACGLANGGSSGHQIVTGRSWMRRGAITALEVPPGLAADRQVDRLRAGLRRVGAGHDAVGRDLGVEPGRPVGIGRLDDRRPRRVAAGEHLDDRRAALADLGPGGDHDEVHHARPGGDVAVVVDLVVVGIDLGVRLGPDPGELLLDLLQAVDARPEPDDRLAGPRERLRRHRRGAALHQAATDGARRDEPPPVRSAATSGLLGPAARRRPRAPTSPPRSSGSPARPRRPRCR